MRLRLLERIRAAERGDFRKGGEAEALIASLERHLSLILNTHQGTSMTVPDFGMPDFVSIMGSSDLDNIRELTKVLADVITRYEPRVQDVKVNFNQASKEAGMLDFSLTCSLLLSGVKREVFFDTVIAPDGSIKIKK
jgi:type VI secretion system protein